jgi:hypothetical protein
MKEVPTVCSRLGFGLVQVRRSYSFRSWPLEMPMKILS